MWSAGPQTSPEHPIFAYSNGAFHNSTIPAPGARWQGAATSPSSTARLSDLQTIQEEPTGSLRPSKVKQQHWSWGSLIYSLFVCVFCNVSGLLCGTVAAIISMLAYTDHKTADYTHSIKKRKVSLCCSTVGLVLGVLVIAGTVVLYFSFFNYLFQSVRNMIVSSESYNSTENRWIQCAIKDIVSTLKQIGIERNRWCIVSMACLYCIVWNSITHLTLTNQLIMFMFYLLQKLLCKELRIAKARFMVNHLMLCLWHRE